VDELNPKQGTLAESINPVNLDLGNIHSKQSLFLQGFESKVDAFVEAMNSKDDVWRIFEDGTNQKLNSLSETIRNIEDAVNRDSKHMAQVLVIDDRNFIQTDVSNLPISMENSLAHINKSMSKLSSDIWDVIRTLATITELRDLHYQWSMQFSGVVAEFKYSVAKLENSLAS
jgi:hypothetical protein